jgi:hypothetical protein
MCNADQDLDWHASRLVAGCWASGLAAGGWRLVAGGLWLVAGGWWLVAAGW